MTTTTKAKLSKKQAKTLEVDTGWYVNRGFPKDVAIQYAFDHLHAYKRKAVIQL